MNCDGVKERLVDFLYEEMATDARAAFEEHLHGCPACRADVAAYRRTLGNARVALSSSLVEPPARVHNAVLEAARAAVGARAAAARTTERKSNETGFFAKLWRTPWLVPAFGAASIATAVFLVRVLKNPEVIPGQRPQSIGEMAEPAAPPSAASSPALPAEMPSAKEETEEARDKGAAGAGLKKAPLVEQKPGMRATREPAQESPREKDAKAGLRAEASGALRAREGGSTDKAPVPAKRKASADALGDLWDDSPSKKGSGAGKSRFSEPPPPRPAASAASSPSEIGAAETGGPRRAGSGKKVGSAELLMDAPLSGVPASDEQAAEPLHQVQSARPAAPPASPSPHAYRDRVMDDLARESAPKADAVPPRLVPSSRAASAPMARPPAPPRPKAAESTRQEESDEDDAPMAAYSDERESAKETEKSAKRQVGPTLEESQRRADRLFAERNWNAAAEAYRDLLRRYPGHKDAGKWRERVDQSLIALRQQRVQQEDATSRVKQ
jgi:hypothetical protein